jgi:hypothetical protein
MDSVTKFQTVAKGILYHRAWNEGRFINEPTFLGAVLGIAGIVVLGIAVVFLGRSSKKFAFGRAGCSDT